MSSIGEAPRKRASEVPSANPIMGAALLSRREAEVAGLVALGMTNRDIAQKLFLSERTVEGHVQQILNKLGFSSRSQIAAWQVEQRAGAPAPPSSAGASATTPPSSKRATRGWPRWWPIAAVVGIAIVAGLEIGGALVAQRPFAGGDGRVRVIASGIVGTGPCIAVNPSGVLYMSDSTQVHTINTAGSLIDLSPPLPHIVGIAFDSAGILYVSRATWEPDAPQIFRVQGANLESVAPQATVAMRVYAACLAFDPEGNLYTYDAFHVYRITPQGRLETYAGSGFLGFSGDGGPAKDAGLDHPGGVAVDAAGDLFIADTLNNRVRKVGRLDGIITTVAGTGRPGGSGDGGQAVDARLNGPAAVAFDQQGNLYISDSDNHRIRRVDRSGRIRTAVGSGRYGSAVEGRLPKDIDMARPGSIAIDGKGNLFVVDIDNNRVLKVRLD